MAVPIAEGHGRMIFSGNHMDRLFLGKVHRGTSKNFCAFLEAHFGLVLQCLVGRRTSKKFFRCLSPS